MTHSNIILIGAGGHTRACIDVIEQHKEYQISGLVGMPQELGENHLGYSVIATDDDFSELIKAYRYAFITIGQIQTPDHRIRLYQQATGLGFQFPTFIASTAYVSPHATIGNGTIVMPGAIINAGSTVGSNCIINSRALLEHDTTVEDHCHISTGTILNGGVHIGSGSFVGSGCTIKENVVLGERCVVGMALAVRKNQPDHTRFLG